MGTFIKWNDTFQMTILISIDKKAYISIPRSVFGEFCQCIRKMNTILHLNGRSRILWHNLNCFILWPKCFRCKHSRYFCEYKIASENYSVSFCVAWRTLRICIFTPIVVCMRLPSVLFTFLIFVNWSWTGVGALNEFMEIKANHRASGKLSQMNQNEFEIESVFIIHFISFYLCRCSTCYDIPCYSLLLFIYVYILSKWPERGWCFLSNPFHLHSCAEHK